MQKNQSMPKEECGHLCDRASPLYPEGVECDKPKGHTGDHGFTHSSSEYAATITWVQNYDDFDRCDICANKLIPDIPGKFETGKLFCDLPACHKGDHSNRYQTSKHHVFIHWARDKRFEC